MFKLGADPEVFVYDTIKNETVSVEGMFLTEDGFGTKRKPLTIEGGFKLQEDNVLAEFNVPPAKTKSEWVENFDFALNAINVFLPDDVVYKIVSSQHLDPKYLTTKQALEIGCEPDINAWENQVQRTSYNGSTLRCAGGHIHIGFDNSDNLYEADVILPMVKAMDMFLGLPSLLIDEDTERREIYGKAGSFRYKDYGFEYRTLSNFWLASKELQEWAWEQTMKALAYDGEVSEEVRIAIDTNDVELAQELCYKLNIEIPAEKVY